MKRRSVLSILISFAASVLLRCKKVREARAPAAAEKLSAAEIETLGQAAECIYPAQAQSPGALFLGIKPYLTQQCATKYYAHAVPQLRRAAMLLDEKAQFSYSRPFSRCTAEERMSAFDIFAKDSTAENAEAFSCLVDITIEGCFSDPKYGGNTGMKAWDVMSDALQEGWYIACECDGYAG